MWNLVKEYIKRKILAPFSNKVTRALLYIGGSLLLLPTIKYIILDLVIRWLFAVSIPFDYPSRESIIAGVIILFLASVHNLFFILIQSGENKIELDIGENRLRGMFNTEEIQKLIRSVPDEQDASLNYEKLREKCQPLITSAVCEIDNGRLEKGHQLLCQVMNELPLGIVGSAYLNYGYYLSCKGSSEDKEYYYAALRVFKDVGFKEGAAKLYQNLGESYRSAHEFKKALDFQLKSVEFRRDIGDEIELADALSSLGLVYAHQCEHESAERIFNESIALYQKHGIQSQAKRVKSYIDTLKSCPNY